MEKHVDLLNARTSEQRKVMKQIIRDGKCPFCPEHIRTYHPHTIEETRHWLITKNAWPYEGTVHQFLLICKRHVQSIFLLNQAEFDDLKETILKLSAQYEFSGETILIRSGDTEFTGATVDHLHVHLIVGKKKSPDTEPIWTVVGFKEKNNA